MKTITERMVFFMRIPVVNSVFDVSEWFLKTAVSDNDPLTPLRLQHLLFLTQGYYAALSKGKLLMPCLFVATARGPVEPNSFRVYADGRAGITASPLPQDVLPLLDGIWRKFGAYSAEFLEKNILEHDPVTKALAHGENTEISLDGMIDFYGNGGQNSKTPPRTFDKPRIMRSQTGKTVTVKKWEPKKR